MKFVLEQHTVASKQAAEQARVAESSIRSQTAEISKLKKFVAQLQLRRGTDNNADDVIVEEQMDDANDPAILSFEKDSEEEEDKQDDDTDDEEDNDTDDEDEDGEYEPGKTPTKLRRGHKKVNLKTVIARAPRRNKLAPVTSIDIDSSTTPLSDAEQPQVPHATASVDQLKELHILTVLELKERLRGLGLPVGGKIKF
jgi:hypothetical protein